MLTIKFGLGDLTSFIDIDIIIKYIILILSYTQLNYIFKIHIFLVKRINQVVFFLFFKYSYQFIFFILLSYNLICFY